MTFHYNNNNQEPTGSCNNLLVVPYIDGKAQIITKLRKLNYCVKPFESSYKNKLITKSLIFKNPFYVNISVVIATFLLTLEICVHLYHVYKCLLNTYVRMIRIWGNSLPTKVFNVSYFMVILKSATWHTKRENSPVITRSQNRKIAN